MQKTYKGTVSGEARNVVTKAVLRAAQLLGLSNGQLSRVLGTSGATITRMNKDAYKLKGKELEIGALFVRMFRSLDAIVGGDQNSAQGWIKGYNTALGAKPIDLITSITGLFNVITYLDTRRAPI